MGKSKIFENNGRVSVLTGKIKIDDMLVFMSYRKLERTLALADSVGPTMKKLSERKE